MLILFKARSSCFTWNYLNIIFENYLKDIYFNSKYLKIRNTNQHSNAHQKTHPNSCCFLFSTELPGVPRNVEISNLRSLALENSITRQTRDDCVIFLGFGIMVDIIWIICIYIYIWSPPPPQDLPMSYFNGIYSIKCLFCKSKKWFVFWFPF